MSIKSTNALPFVAIVEQNISILAAHQQGISFLVPLYGLKFKNYSNIRLLIRQSIPQIAL